MDTVFPPFSEGRILLLGKGVSVDKYVRGGYGSKGYFMQVFWFHYFVSGVWGTNRSGKETPKFITQLIAFKNCLWL